MSETTKNTPAADAVGSRIDRGVGRPVPERGIASMTNAELQSEIGRLQRELTRRVCGDPVRGIGLRLGVHPTCWCRTCDRTVSSLPQRMNLCPECGDKRCPRADHHDAACSKTPNAQVTGQPKAGPG